jgi:two-component system chemotaxis response regulator CheY
MDDVIPRRYALVIEDDGEFLETLKLMLTVCGIHDVQIVCDGEIALEFLKKWRFDLVLCDWYIEPINGIQVLKSVRANPVIKEIPFILMTASLSEEAWHGAIAHGATDFLIKPFSLKMLKEACDICLKFSDWQRDNIVSLAARRKVRSLEGYQG